MAIHSRCMKLLVALTVFAISVAAFAAEPPAAPKAAEKSPAKSKILVTLSKETTYITEPLRSDGYPDYVAALNQRLSQGVTPENNAAVLLWKAMGPSEIPEKIREDFFQMLGIPPLPEKDDYFVKSRNFLDRYLTEYKDAAEVKTNKEKEAWEQFSFIMKRPWSKQEFPLWAGWVEGNQKQLAMIVEATKRPKGYEPLIGDMVICVLLPGAQQSREAARGLVADAMYRLHEGKTDEAWEDLLACHRLARLVGQGSTLVDTLVAITLNAMAEAGDQALLEHGKLSSAQISKMRADLANLAPISKMAEKLDVAERFMFLDAVTMMAREGPSKISQLAGGGSQEKDKSSLESFMDTLAKETIDWDIILRMGNSWYDRIQDACHKPTRAEQQKAWNSMEVDLKKMAKEARDLKSLGLSLLGGPSKAISERVGQVLVALLLPALSAAMNAENRTSMQSELNGLAFALAAYRADHGSYPAKLADLSPKYAAKMPKDIFSNDAELHYGPKGDGYLLYSVGANGQDDGGMSFDDVKADGTKGDDLVVRVPAVVKP